MAGAGGTDALSCVPHVFAFFWRSSLWFLLSRPRPGWPSFQNVPQERAPLLLQRPHSLRHKGGDASLPGWALLGDRRPEHLLHPRRGVGTGCGGAGSVR